MTRKGVTIAELLVVLTIVGIFVLIGFPRIKDALFKDNVRAARVAAATYVATARAVAIQRGCTGVVHFAGSAGTLWVTVCPRMSTQGSGTIDTIGMVNNIASRYGITLSESLDSVQFDPRGLSATNAQSTVWFTASSGPHDSILINQIGKVVR